MDEPGLIHFEAGFTNPGRCAGCSDPEDLIQIDGFAAGDSNRAGRNFCHFYAGVDFDAARRQKFFEAPPHTDGKGRQDGFRLGEQVTPDT